MGAERADGIFVREKKAGSVCLTCFHPADFVLEYHNDSRSPGTMVAHTLHKEVFPFDSQEE